MLKRLALFSIVMIASVFIARTWRFDHAAAIPTEDLGQYLHDQIESNGQFLNKPHMHAFVITPGTFDSAVKQFSRETGILVLVRWDTLVKAELHPDTHCNAIISKTDASALGTLQNIIREALKISRPSGIVQNDFHFEFLFRRQGIVISGNDFSDADLVWRGYLVQDLMETFRSSTTDKSAEDGKLHRHSTSDTEECFSLLKDFINVPVNDHPKEVRLNGNVIEVRATIEFHMDLYDRFKRIRQEWGRGYFHGYTDSAENAGLDDAVL